MASGTTTTVSIKLLIDMKKNKVLFAEAGKDFVDFIFSLFVLPLGTVTCLLKKENMVGSLGNLYESVESLSSTYMQPNTDKNLLLKPQTATSSCSTGLALLLLGDDQMPGANVYRMSRAANWVVKKVVDVGLASASSVGYVTGAVTYMVMDDLKVEPMSFSLAWNKVTSMEEVGVIEEKVVELNMAEGLKLLKESLQSEMVLTNVFLRESSA